MHRLSTLVLAALTAGAPAAQTTWIVDENNGPGTNFTDLPPAEAAAAPGDILFVRGGNYSSLETSKGITVIGEPGAFPSIRTGNQGGVSVTDLPAGQVFTMAGFSVSYGYPVSGFVIQNAEGAVHLQSCSANGTWALLFTLGPALAVSSSNAVTVTGCTFRGLPAAAVGDSDVTFTDVNLLGYDNEVAGFRASGAGAGLAVRSSRVSLSRSNVTGGSDLTSQFVFMGLSLYFPEPAIDAVDSTIIATGLDEEIRGGSIPVSPKASGRAAGVFAQNGSLVFDPNLVVQGGGSGLGFEGTAVLTERRVVSLHAEGGALGGGVDCEIVSPAGNLIALFLGVPTVATPSPFGPVYLDLSTALSLAFLATQPANERFALGFGVPNVPALRGAALALQAANFYTATSMIEMSNAAVLILR